jgi:hypothetical protein
VAYAAQQGGKWLVVVDAEPGPTCDAVGPGSPIFSPDSQHVAYAARQGCKWVVVVDGMPSPIYDDIMGDLMFSPDSQHVVCVVGRGRRVLLVLDGKPGPTYDGMLRCSRLVFDGPASLYTLGVRNKIIYRVEVTMAQKP